MINIKDAFFSISPKGVYIITIAFFTIPNVFSFSVDL